MPQYLLWSDIESGIWSQANFTWGEAQIIIELINEGGGGYNVKDYWSNINNKSEDKKKKIITIIAKLKDEEFRKSKTKSPKKITISISDVKLLVEKLNIDIHV